MRRVLRILIPFAALLTAMPTAAQRQTGSMINRNPGAVRFTDPSDAANASRVMNQFGRCVARSDERRALRVLALPLLSPEQDRAARAMFDSPGHGCFDISDSGTLRFRSLMLTGSMAESFIVNDYANADLTPIAQMTEDSQLAIGLGPRNGYEDIAICVARSDAPGVMALVRSEPGSDAEQSAINRIIPQLGPCLPAGQEFNLGLSPLRALLAAGFHRTLSMVNSSRQGQN